MKNSRKKWFIPDSYIKSGKMVNGEEYNAKMVGAYYGSSLELSARVVPQYHNAGNLEAPVHKQVRDKFKPKKPFGTFGALVDDEDQRKYSFEMDRIVLELPSIDDIEKVDESISDNNVWSQAKEVLKDLRYERTDGSTFSYEEAYNLQKSYKDHNEAIQAKIDAVIREAGYAPEVRNGRKINKSFPDSLLQKVAQLANLKKSVTGFVLRVQMTGKHTVAKDGCYLTGSLDQNQLDQMRSKLKYKEKESFSQGTVRVGTLNIPIQSEAQLEKVITALNRAQAFRLKNWPEAVMKSTIRLERKYDEAPESE